MMPIVLVLLVATSALAAPSVTLHQYGVRDLQPLTHNGNAVSGYITDRAFSFVDGGDTNPYILTAQQIINDIANLPDRASHALAIGQTVSVLTELATGIPGDACAAANVIDAFISGDQVALAEAAKGYAAALVKGVDQIVELAINPHLVRNAVGPRGNCVGGGRTYAFEAAWDVILSNNANELLSEEYCAAKRLYNSFNVRSNNVGAYLTAAAIPPVQAALVQIVEPLTNFVAALGTGNADQFASAAKRAILSSA